MENKYKEALNSLNEYIKELEKDEKNYLSLAKLYIDLKEYDKAESYFLKLYDKDLTSKVNYFSFLVKYKKDIEKAYKVLEDFKENEEIYNFAKKILKDS